MRLSDANISVDVNALAQQLAKIAGPIAQHGWEVYVKQQVIIGWQEAVASSFLLLLAIACAVVVVLILRDLRKEQKEHPNMETVDHYGFTALFVGIGLILFMFALGFGMDSFSHLANPEYGAIQGILGRN